MMRLYLIAPALFLCILASGFAHGQQWTRFRGPNGSGLAADSASAIPARWNESDYHWKVRLPGEGHSSPVIWGERIFLTCTDSQSAERIIVCLGTADGAVIWKREYESMPYRQHVENSYASSSPAVDAEHIYLCWTTPEQYILLALDHDGNEVWRTGLGPYVSQHGSGTSPILFEDMVILTNDQEGRASSIIAVDRKTGHVRWTSPRKSGVMAASTPCIYQSPGQAPQLILTSQLEGIAALDPYTGQLMWQVPDAFDRRVVASPIVAGELVIGNCGQGPRGRSLIAVRPGSPERKAEVAYKLTSEVPYVPTPVYKEGLLFLLTDLGTVSCVRASSGEPVWQERIAPGESYFSSPICVGDKLFCISKKGKVTVLRAGERYEPLGESSLGESCNTTPAIADDRMYIRTLTQLICIGGKN